MIATLRFSLLAGLCLNTGLLVSAPASAAPRQQIVLPSVKPQEVDGKTFDLVVAEATPGGIAMAVRAAREGLQVLLVNHNHHLGGILTSGLGVWDTLWE